MHFFGQNLNWMLFACQHYYNLNWVQILLVTTPDVEFDKKTPLLITPDGMAQLKRKANIQMKVNSLHTVHRCAFTLFGNCQFIAYSVFNCCLQLPSCAGFWLLYLSFTRLKENWKRAILNRLLTKSHFECDFYFKKWTNCGLPQV